MPKNPKNRGGGDISNDMSIKRTNCEKTCKNTQNPCDCADEKSLPLSILEDENPVFTMRQASAVVRFLSKMFYEVYLTDPKTCKRYILNEKGCLSETKCKNLCGINDGKCYAAAECGKRSLSRIEITENNIYNTVSAHINICGRRYILEMISYIENYSDSAAYSKDEKQVLKGIAAHRNKLYTDSVTGVYNRRYYDDNLRDLEGELVFAMLDVDNFKQINDTYGHLAGDAALAAAAQAIKSTVRSCDDVIRYGGDEFFLFFRDMPKEVIYKKLEEIRRAVELVRIEDYPDLRMTVSIGGAVEKGRLSKNLRKADMAMYKAKDMRNSIWIYNEE